jgi:glutaminyl-tRNA synthetase
VFNKTVGLRDTWVKKPQITPTNSQVSSQASKRKPLDLIKQLGKKYTNLPELKQQKVKAEIQLLAKGVSYEDLEPLFNTAAKKVGTRIAVVIALKVLITDGLELNHQIDAFLQAAKADKAPLLSQEV